jgi:hypothetical protein
MQASESVTGALRRYLKALADGDAVTLSEMVSRQPGVTAIGSDPSEFWQSGEEWVSSLSDLLGQIGGLPVTPGDPHGFEEGSVGWAYDRPVISGREDLQFRMAAVFHREAADWKLVMLHASLAVDVAGMER